MKKSTSLLVIILLALNLAATGAVAFFVFGNDAETQFVMYIGTNDKDTGKPEIPFETCRDKVVDICTRNTDGCTVFEATGVWKSGERSAETERTLVCVFDGVSEKQVESIADEVISSLNQSSVLIERRGVKTVFYGG